MGQVRLGCATTKHAVRAAIQRSQALTRYNHRRYHESLVNLTLAYVYFG